MGHPVTAGLCNLDLAEFLQILVVGCQNAVISSYQNGRAVVTIEHRGKVGVGITGDYLHHQILSNSSEHFDRTDSSLKRPVMKYLLKNQRIKFFYIFFINLHDVLNPGKVLAQ